ncbi:hypothetical protein BDV11DRAFT_209366 [Aspergillus similis]
MTSANRPFTRRPTIVIVHGEWHNPTHYDVLIPRLLSMNGARLPNSGLYTDSDHMYTESLADAGHRLVAQMHSYLGEQLNLPGGVIRLVYLSAHALTKQFLLDAFIIADDGTVEYRDVRGRMIGPGLSEEELESYVARLRPWNGQALYQEIRAVAWMEIPLMPVAYQNAMVADIRSAGKEVETFELETGHCAHATMTVVVVEILHTVTSRETKEQRG